MRILIVTLLVLCMITNGVCAMGEELLTAKEIIDLSGETFDTLDMDMLDYFLSTARLTKSMIEKMDKERIIQLINSSQRKSEINLNYLFYRSVNPQKPIGTVKKIALYLNNEMRGKAVVYNLEKNEVYYDPSHNTISDISQSSIHKQDASDLTSWAETIVLSADWNSIQCEYRGNSLVGGYSVGLAVDTDTSL